MTSTPETAAIVALLRMRAVAAREVADLVEDHGSAAEALEHVLTCPDDDSLQLFSLAPADGDEAVDLAAIEAEVEAWLADGMAIATILDPEYPENLHTVHDRPPLLFVHGALRPTDACSIAVVGTRKASPAGLESASTMARTMVAAGYVVVSGLAAGIDTAAHRAALEAGGRTVAVIDLRRDRPGVIGARQPRSAGNWLHFHFSPRGLLADFVEWHLAACASIGGVSDYPTAMPTGRSSRRRKRCSPAPSGRRPRRRQVGGRRPRFSNGHRMSPASSPTSSSRTTTASDRGTSSFRRFASALACSARSRR